MQVDDLCFSLFRGPGLVDDVHSVAGEEAQPSPPFASIQTAGHEWHGGLLKAVALNQIASRQRRIWIMLAQAQQDGDRETRIAPPLMEQFVEISALADGWCGPGSLRMDDRLLEDLKYVLVAVMRRLSLAPPFVFPQRNGSLRAEWTVGSTEISIDADYPQFSLYMHAADLDATGFVESELPLRPDAQTVQAVATFLSPLFYPST